jgi:hypothetical protein
MNDKRTCQNLTSNRYATCLFKDRGPEFNGVRLTLELIRTEKKAIY